MNLSFTDEQWSDKMSEIKKYGEQDWESTIVDNSKAREIVQVIMDHGVNQNQILRIIYLLSLELDNREQMLEISNLIKNMTEDGEANTSVLV